jgi:hypothetical protein
MASLVIHVLLFFVVLHLSSAVQQPSEFEAAASSVRYLAKYAELPPASSLHVLQPHLNAGSEISHDHPRQATGDNPTIDDAAFPEDGIGNAAKLKGFLANLAAVNQDLAEQAPLGVLGQSPQGIWPESQGIHIANRYDTAPLRQRLENVDEPVQQVPQAKWQSHFDSVPRLGSASQPALVQKMQENIQAAGASMAPILRPQAASGKPDVVKFGLYGKMFFGTNLKKHEFTIDSVMTLRWSDMRAVSLVPAGQDTITLSDDEAKVQMWLPQIEITDKVDLNSIASSLTVGRDGIVTKVERSLVVVKNRFALEQYPFDEQKLRLNIASSKYMSKELNLATFDKSEYSGLREGFFDDDTYEKTDFKVGTYEDDDGFLKKSRGFIEITVIRTLGRYQQNFLLPAILYSAVACAVFFLPISQTFIVPRLALSVLILLVFTGLALSADSELPAGAPYNWIDLTCFAIQLHMFSVICFNIFIEVAYHSMNCQAAATTVNHQLRILSPAAIGLVIASISIAGSTREKDGILSLKMMKIVLPVSFAVYLATYMTCCSIALRAETAKNSFSPTPPKNTENFQSDFHGGALGSTESLPPKEQDYTA